MEGDLKRFPGREHQNVFKFPGREHQNVFKFLGEGKLNRGREFENVFKFPGGGDLNQGELENVTPGHDVQIHSISGTGYFICPVAQTGAGNTKAFIYPVVDHWGESQSAPAQGRFETPS